MLPEITIGMKKLNVQNVSTVSINWKKVIVDLRKQNELRMYQISSLSGISYTKIQKASSNHPVRFSDCEKIALLDLHQEYCNRLTGILNNE